MATSSEISLSQSAWDDETPGPSYSTLSHPQAEEVEPEGIQLGGTSTATEQCEHNNNGKDEEEECMIVGYVKPMAERTPELVELSSDSTEEEEAGDEAAATDSVMKAESSLPSHEQAPLSPKQYPSTSHTERGDNLEQSRKQDVGNQHHRMKEHTRRRGFRKQSHSLSGSHSLTSSESSPQSGHSVKIARSHIRLSCREPRRQGDHLFAQSTTVCSTKDVTSSEELVPNHSISTRDKPSRSFSPWDSPGQDGERRKKKRKRRREREAERSRSPHRESRHRRGDRELWLGSSSSSDADSHREKPAGKRKYKTRHLERTARQRSRRKSRDRKRERERERSPSVEIIFERRASDTHFRSRRHKKKSRRREREQNPPTIITIDSDSSSHHTANCLSRHTEGNSNDDDYQDCLIDSNKDYVASDHNADHQDRAADDSERVTDFSDHTIDYQEHLAEFSDHTTNDKDCITDSRNSNTDSKDVSDQKSGTAFIDCTAEYKDSVASVSNQISNYKEKDTEVDSYTTDCKHSVQKASDKATKHLDHAAGASNHAADYKPGITEVNRSRADYKSHKEQVSGHMACSKVCDAEANDQDDFLADIGNQCEPDVRALDMLNLEHCLVDVVQPNRRDNEDNRRAATLLSDTQLLELEDSLLEERQEILRNVTVGQQDASLVAHSDQSEASMETELADVMRDREC